MTANAPTTALLSRLTEILGQDRLLTDADALSQYGCDWSKLYTPQPMAVALPKTIDEVQQIVRLANEEQIALVPSGGRTGLSGGAAATQGELVVALDKMNQIEDFNPINRTARCQAGVITQQLQEYAEQQGLFYPVDFASAGSSQIGGNISTNAGGIKVIRYGMTRDWVRGLKVITGNGDLLELNGELVKNNTGYDLRQLFIGAEGTLGIIVEATMALTRPPEPLQVLMLGVADLPHIMDVLQTFQQKVDLTAFEFFSEAAMQKVIKHQNLQRPFDETAPYYALLEFEQGDEQQEAAVLGLFETCVEQGWVLDGVLSQSQQQLSDLWRLREDISETLSQWTPYKNDISVAIDKVPHFLLEIDNIVRQHYPDFEVIWFGHIGDGNLHLNILKPDTLSKEEFVQHCQQVNGLVFEAVQKYSGSISAEHGVGLSKKPYLHYSRSSTEINAMQQIKQVFDNKKIMNPGKVID